MNLNEYRLVFFCTYPALTTALDLVSPIRNTERQLPDTQTLVRKWLHPNTLGISMFWLEQRSLGAVGSKDTPRQPSRVDPKTGTTSLGESCPTKIGGKAPTNFNSPTATHVFITVHFMFITFVPCPTFCVMTIVFSNKIRFFLLSNG